MAGQSRAVATLVMVLAAVACGDDTKRVGQASGAPAAVGPRDSLVVRKRDVEIWFTLAREAAGSDGTRCTERGIEIRRDSTRLKVPLLYTGAAPVFLNDTIIRARLWTHCEPGAVYLVDVRNGRPTKEH